jgi:hypothetical protein
MASIAVVSTVQPPTNLTFSKGLTTFFGELKIDNKNGLLNAGNLQFTSNSTISGYALNINKKSDNTSALTIDNLGSINTNGRVTTSSSLNSGSLNTNSINVYTKGTSQTGSPNLTISDTGDLTTNGTIYAKNISIATGTFTSVNAGGGASFADNNAKIGTDGHFETNFSNYIISQDLRNSHATMGNLTTTSATSKYLTTQNYVDDGLWYIQKQLNQITNLDSTSLESFKNVFDLVKKMAGDDATINLQGLLDTTAEIKFSISDVIANSENTIVMNCKSEVWGDACAPLPIPASIANNYLFDGWFFQNMVYMPDTSTTNTNNITWFISPNGNNMTIADIQNMYTNIFAISNNALPFISVYTQPKGTNGNSSENFINNFAHACINYYFSVETPSTTSNTSYCLYTGAEPPLNNYNATNLICKSTSTANGLNKNNGTYGTVKTGNTYDSSIVQPTDKIACFAISTDSHYTINDVKFILSSFSLKEKTGTTKFLFNNASVATNFLYNMNLRLNIDMTPISSTQYGESVVVDEVNSGGTYFEKYKETYIMQ